MITIDNDTLKAMLESAYAMGFAASGEGWNADYPFDGRGNDYEDDEHWCASRDRHIDALIAEIMKQGG
jgi:hypothetical protein